MHSWALVVLVALTGALYPACSVAASTAVPNKGATVPWTTFEAEGGRTNGVVIDSGAAAQESSGSRAIALTQIGHYVEFTATVAANRAVLRFSVPMDQQSSLSLYIDGRHVQDIRLGSEKLYEVKNSSNGPVWVRYFDELALAVDIQSGQTLRLQKTADDGIQVLIDLVDLEMAPGPIAMPEGFLSVTDFGAVPDDGEDDFYAINDTIREAQKQGKGVWFPPGIFHQSERIIIPAGVTVSGSGVWYTTLYGYINPSSADGSTRAGFVLSGNNTRLEHLHITSAIDKREKTRPAIGTANDPINWAVEDVWIEYTNTGFWLVGGRNGLVRNNRVRNTYADGIHASRLVTDTVIENNHIRGCGDDGIAVVSSEPETAGPAVHVTARHNTVTAGYWGRGMAVVGGNDILYEDNLITDIAYFAGVYIARERSYNTHTVRGAVVQRNTIIRSGGDTIFNAPHGGIHVWAGADALYGIEVLENAVLQARKSGIYLEGSYAQETTLRGNVVKEPRQAAIVNRGQGQIVIEENIVE